MKELVLWPQRQLDMFTELMEARVAGMEEGRKRKKVGGGWGRQVKRCRLDAEQIRSPRTLKACVQILAFTVIEIRSNWGL